MKDFKYQTTVTVSLSKIKQMGVLNIHLLILIQQLKQ